MATITRIFLQGLLALLPLFLSVYFLYWFLSSVELFVHSLLVNIIPTQFYITGMGTLLGIILIFGAGLLMSSNKVRYLYSWIEMPFNRVPLVKSIYSAIRDLIEFFSPKGKKMNNQVVKIKHPDHPIEFIGFLTNKDLKNLPAGIERQGKVAVYFPLSYQIGGMTCFIPEQWVTPLDMRVEVAMRSALTAWMPGKVEVPEARAEKSVPQEKPGDLT